MGNTKKPAGGTGSVSSEFVLKYQDWLKRLARSLALDDSGADEVVQQVWLTAIETKVPVSRERDLRPWLKTVARNAVSHIRRSETRRSVRERKAGKIGFFIETALMQQAETRQILQRFVNELREPYRSTLRLHYFEEKNLEEIGRLQGIPGATVRTRLKRGLEQLRARLDAHYGERRAWGLMLLPIFAAPDLDATPLVPSNSPTVSTAAPAGKASVSLSGWGIGLLLALVPVAAFLAISTGGMEPDPSAGETYTAMERAANEAAADRVPPAFKSAESISGDPLTAKGQESAGSLEPPAKQLAEDTPDSSTPPKGKEKFGKGGKGKKFRQSPDKGPGSLSSAGAITVDPDQVRRGKKKD